MSTDPRHHDGGYALTPGPDDVPAEDHAGDATTAHHEELLRTEALAARRGNRAVARFAVVGLVAALAVGVVTWRNTVTRDNGPERSDVVDASADSDLVRDSVTSGIPTPPRPPRTPAPGPADTQPGPADVQPGPADVQPGPADADGGIVTLHEDPYLPPNAWNGGHALAPSTTGAGDATTGRGSGDTTTPRSPAAPRPSVDDGRPLLPQFPSTLPALPALPGGSSAPTTDGTGDTGRPAGQPHSTEPEEPTVTAPSLSVAPSTPAPSQSPATTSPSTTAEPGHAGTDDATGSPSAEPTGPTGQTGDARTGEDTGTSG